MTKPELVDALAERTGMKKKDAELFLKRFHGCGHGNREER